jgi:hypothetical protein
MRNKNIIAISLSVALSFVFVAVAAYASTTISTDISTGGTLTVNGATSLNGGSTFGDAATDVNLFTGTLQASTTALFTSGLTSYGTITLQNADTITNSSVGAIGLSGTTTMAAGAKIGSSGTALNIVLTGTCTVDFGVSITAGLATTTNCTATGVLIGDKVFMTPTGLENRIAFNSASSTINDKIQVQVFNTSTSTAVTVTSHTWYWMATR